MELCRPKIKKVLLSQKKAFPIFQEIEALRRALSEIEKLKKPTLKKMSYILGNGTFLL